tara:strand:- start:71 stop:316 length:246 start_codon:yes stop_codon:yes gene_type:complete
MTSSDDEAINGMQRSEALRQAAELIDSVVELLDKTGGTCEECGSTRRYNWEEYRVAMSLIQMPRKLREYASKFDNDIVHVR